MEESIHDDDRTTKKVLYQSYWQTPEYFWCSPKTLEFCGFRLGSQRVYNAIVPTDRGWLWSRELNLYLGIHDRQLRYFDAQGQLVPTLQEFNRLEIQRTELERQRASALALEVDRLRQQLQGQGGDNE